MAYYLGTLGGRVPPSRTTWEVGYPIPYYLGPWMDPLAYYLGMAPWRTTRCVCGPMAYYQVCVRSPMAYFLPDLGLNGPKTRTDCVMDGRPVSVQTV